MEINLENGKFLVNSDVVSLLSNVLLVKILLIIRTRLHVDHNFSGRFRLQVEDVIKLMAICIKTTYIEESYLLGYNTM
jgi:hypothetical protein